MSLPIGNIWTYRWWYSAYTCIVQTPSVCFLSSPHVAYFVCLWTGCPGLQGEDAPQHHQMDLSNSHGMFRSFKTMTSYCWWAYSEMMFFSLCVVGFQLLDISELLYQAWSLLCCLPKCPDCSFPGCTTDRIIPIAFGIAQTERAGNPRHPTSTGNNQVF